MTMTTARALLALAFAATTMVAQSGASAISGKIVGSDTTPIVGAAVVAIDQNTGAVSETTTNDTGVFLADALNPGKFLLEVRYRGEQLTAAVEIIQPGQIIDIGRVVLQVPTASPANVDAPPASNVVPPRTLESVTVTARRFEEVAQEVPIPLSVISGELAQSTGAFNVNRIKELIPTVQFYSSNPRNSAVNIRGIGSPFGLTNDGIDAGVGFYVDGVFYARPAAATLDFIDIEQVEVLRGPQGTLYGKNTTAGAINITTRRPTFVPEAQYELNYGNFGFVQAKASVSGPLSPKVAARISFSGTQRNGVLYNVRTQDDVNDLNNIGFRGQVLYVPRGNLAILFSADASRQRPEGYAQVIAGVAPTLRNPNRQYPQIAQDLGYTPPSWNPFDRLIDTDTPWRSNQNMGGGSVTVDWSRSAGSLTSITAWRYWDWNPSNDRDFIGLPVTTASQAPSKQRQWTQEVRYTGNLTDRAKYVAGVFFFHQTLRPDGFHRQQQGDAAGRFLLSPTAEALTPGLLDDYTRDINFDFNNTSAAAFGQIEWELTNRWSIIPGLRFNYDNKNLDFNQRVYGGLETDDPTLNALKLSILSPLQYQADVSDNNLSGQVTVAYEAGESTHLYATYGTGFKSVGLNLGGVPNNAQGQPALDAAVVRPEDVRQWEFGVKSQPFRWLTANLAAFHTGIKDFQTQVVNSQVGVLRGYLANARKVGVRGLELDLNSQFTDQLSLYGSLAFTDGRYLDFQDAPPPLEETGGPQVTDISGRVLPGISKWAYSVGGEYKRRGTLLGLRGEYFARVDASYRSSFSSNATPSRYLRVGSYALVNPRAGFRGEGGWSFSVWARNLGNTDYFELMQAVGGNSGLYVGLPGDPRTFGITLSQSLSDVF